MKRVLEGNVWLLLLVVIILGYLLNFIAIDVVKNETLWQQHLNEKYDEKYDEYKELDIDLSEFEEELKEFEQQSNEEDTSYGWDYFYVDTLSIMSPIVIVVFGYSCLLLVLLLFHKKLHTIRYASILKTTVLSYLVFFIPEAISNFYFLVFGGEYKIEDVQNFNRYFYTSTYFDKEEFSTLLWTAISDFDLIYIIFPALVALGIKTLYKQFSIGLLLGYCYLAYFFAFVFYEIIMWYIFGF